MDLRRSLRIAGARGETDSLLSMAPWKLAVEFTLGGMPAGSRPWYAETVEAFQRARQSQGSRPMGAGTMLRSTIAATCAAGVLMLVAVLGNSPRAADETTEGWDPFTEAEYRSFRSFYYDSFERLFGIVGIDAMPGDRDAFERSLEDFPPELCSPVVDFAIFRSSVVGSWFRITAIPEKTRNLLTVRIVFALAGVPWGPLGEVKPEERPAALEAMANVKAYLADAEERLGMVHKHCVENHLRRAGVVSPHRLDDGLRAGTHRVSDARAVRIHGPVRRNGPAGDARGTKTSPTSMSSYRSSPAWSASTTCPSPASVDGSRRRRPRAREEDDAEQAKRRSRTKRAPRRYRRRRRRAADRSRTIEVRRLPRDVGPPCGMSGDSNWRFPVDP